MSYTFTVTDTIPAAPQAVYDAWLDSRAHSAMTGGAAEISPLVGGKFTAWDGYISGTTLALVPGARIVQAWRTTRFTAEQPDSQITVTLAPVAGGTVLTLTHAMVPDDHTGYEKGGWQDNYFAPMKAYFAQARHG
jgi:uncharacterized protein YndB with AHSA1/START domain